MKGYKLVIPGEPLTYKSGKIEYKPRPHILPHPDTLEYRETVRKAIREIYHEDFVFDRPVEIEIEFYHRTRRLINNAGCAQVLLSALTPHLLKHTGHAKKIITASNCDSQNPRTVVIIRPLV